VGANITSMRSEIHVCTLNEEGQLEDTLKSLSSQGPDIVVIDSNSEDGTVDIASSYAKEVITVQRGKLVARDIGMSRTDADVVMSADAGDIYPDGWADAMMEPFRNNSNTVAVQGPSYSKELLWTVKERAHSRLKKHVRLQGNNSSVRVDAYEAVGGLDLSVDQQNRRMMILEEEIRLRRRLSGEGDVVFNPEARCYKSQRHMILSRDMDMGYVREALSGERF